MSGDARDDLHLRSEGDLNLSPNRRKWAEDNIGPQTRAWLDEDERWFVRQSLSTPCLNVLGACDGIWIEDLEGRRYMDFHGNNVHQVGFRNPRVIEAIKAQLDTLPFCTRRYTNVPAIRLAKKLAELAPGNLDKVLFAPGGTTAVGMALKLARAATGRFKTISLWDSFHGTSLDAISVGGEAIFRQGIGPLLILDEVPYGLGRTGKWFACEHYGVVPDMLVLGKGLGGGVFPLAALLAREDLDQALDIVEECVEELE